MKDILGNEINVGDVVVTNDKNYSNLVFARIYKLTPKNARCFIVNLAHFEHSIYSSYQLLKLSPEQINKTYAKISKLFNTELILEDTSFTIEEKQKLMF